MNSFSNDVDILRYEPSLFGDLHFSGQVLASGDGAEISGATLTAPNADFNASQIAASMVIYLQNEDGLVNQSYEIVSVDSATQLTISVLRVDSESEAIAPGDAEDISYRICSYQPQSSEVFLQLTQYFGLRPGVADADYSADDIGDASVLRQVSVYRTLSLLYATISGKANEKEENFWKKSQYYQQLYEKALQRCRVSIDVGNDGVSDSVSSGASVKLRRG